MRKEVRRPKASRAHDPTGEQRPVTQSQPFYRAQNQKPIQKFISFWTILPSH